ACPGTSLDDLRDALRLEEERLPVTDFVGPDETVRCSVPRDVPLVVTFPALPAAEIHLAEGPTLLAGEWQEPSLAERLATLERAIAREVIKVAEIKRLTSPTAENAGLVSGDNNAELTFLSAVHGLLQTLGKARFYIGERQRC